MSIDNVLLLLYIYIQNFENKLKIEMLDGLMKIWILTIQHSSFKILRLNIRLHIYLIIFFAIVYSFLQQIIQLLFRLNNRSTSSFVTLPVNLIL